MQLIYKILVKNSDLKLFRCEIMNGKHHYLLQQTQTLTVLSNPWVLCLTRSTLLRNSFECFVISVSSTAPEYFQ